jgi:hypothetical protein
MIQKHTLKRISLTWLFWMLVIIAGSGYGLLGYGVFNAVFSGKNSSGVMLVSFLIGIPFSCSATISYFLDYTRRTTLKKRLVVCIFVLIVGTALSALIFAEGAICIALFLGIAVIASLMGVFLGALIASIKRNKSKHTFMSIVAILPFGFGAIEQQMIPSNAVYEVKSSIFVEASAETIWHTILNPTHITQHELEEGWAYKIGVPYPVEAKLTEQKVGGIRKSVWQRGISFDEEITAIQKNRHIEWVYHFTEQSFPAGSLDDHVKIGGTYFDLYNTAYTLRPAKNGAFLDISVKYRVTTHFNWYAAPWAYFFINDTSQVLLRFYKKRSELRETV